MPGYKYIFPPVNANTIVNDLSQYINITTTDITQPTAESIKVILEDILFLFTGTHPSERAQISARMITSIKSNPAMFQNSIGDIYFMKKTYQLFQAIGVPDFDPFQLLDPKPNRIIILFSAIINFLRYRNDRLITITDSILETANYNEEVEKNEQISQQLEVQRMNLLAEKESKRIETESICGEVEELEFEISQLNKQQALLQKDKKEISNSIKETLESVKEIKFRITTKLSEIKKLESQIVSSPEALKQEIENLQKQLPIEEDNLLKLEQEKINIANHSVSLEKSEKQKQKILTAMKKLGETQLIEKKLKKDLQEKNEEAKVIQSSISEFETLKKHLTKQFISRSKLLEEQTQSHSEKKKELLQEVDLVKKKKTEAIATVQSNEKIFNDLRQQVENVRIKKEQSEAEAEKLTDELTDKYTFLSQEWGNYRNNVLTTLQKSF